MNFFREQGLSFNDMKKGKLQFSPLLDNDDSSLPPLWVLGSPFRSESAMR
jgi:hypothetical protein